MPTATDSKLTQQDEELAAHGDLVAVVPCDATGTLRGVDTTNRLYTRGTLRQVDGQFNALLALWTEINDNLIAIRDATGGTVTIDDTNLPVLVAALGAAIETAQDLADATEAAVGVGEWEPLLPLGSTFSGAGWYDPSEFIDGAGLRWRHARGQIEVQGRAIYLDGSGSPAVPAGGAAIATLPTEAQPADPAPLVAWETPADLTDITTVAARVDADGSIHAAPVTTFAVTLLASTLFDPTTP